MLASILFGPMLAFISALDIYVTGWGWLSGLCMFAIISVTILALVSIHTNFSVEKTKIRLAYVATLFRFGISLSSISKPTTYIYSFNKICTGIAAFIIIISGLITLAHLITNSVKEVPSPINIFVFSLVGLIAGS